MIKTESAKRDMAIIMADNFLPQFNKKLAGLSTQELQDALRFNLEQINKYEIGKKKIKATLKEYPGVDDENLPNIGDSFATMDQGQTAFENSIKIVQELQKTDPNGDWITNQKLEQLKTYTDERNKDFSDFSNSLKSGKDGGHVITDESVMGNYYLRLGVGKNKVLADFQENGGEYKAEFKAAALDGTLNGDNPRFDHVDSFYSSDAYVGHYVNAYDQDQTQKPAEPAPSPSSGMRP